MYEAESFAPLGLFHRCRSPTAYAVGCILPPLRGFAIDLDHNGWRGGLHYSVAFRDWLRGGQGAAWERRLMR